MKKPDINERGAYYQRLLRLQDWRIKFAYVRDLQTADGRKLYGLCDPLVDNKTARIWIRDPETPVDDGCDPYRKADEALVHELSHLHFAPFGTRSPAEIAAEEQAVWAFAEAICAAKGTPGESYAARAMLARITSRAASAATRRNDMDIAMFIAALEAALEAEDPKMAIQALLEKVKGMGIGGAEEAPLEQAAPEEPKPGEVMAAIAEMRAQLATMANGGAGRGARAPAGASVLPPEILEMRRERVRAMAERNPGVVSAETERHYLASGDADGFSTLIGEVKRHAVAPRGAPRIGDKPPANGPPAAGAGLSDFERYQAAKGGITPEKFEAAKVRQASLGRGRGK